MTTTRPRLILVRHGQTPANVDGRLDTDVPGLGLTPLGLEQAAALPASLTSESIGLIATSQLRRAGLTARPLAQQLQLDPLTLPGLAEISAGALEMRHDDAAKLTYLETAFAWSAGDLELHMPGGENGRAFFDRFDRAIDELAGKLHDAGRTGVAVSHGAAIRVWLAARAVNITVDYAAQNALGNTGRVTVQRNTHGWEVLSWNSEPSTTSAAVSTGQDTGDAARSTSGQLSHPPDPEASNDPTGASLTDLHRGDVGRDDARHGRGERDQRDDVQARD